MTWPNIFDSGFRLPRKVCIVAPGPMGLGHYESIPDEFLVIAVSKAVLIPGLPTAVWMMNHVTQPWYETASASFRGTRVFMHDAVEAIPSRLQAIKGADWYSFVPPEEPLGLDEFMSIEGCIRIGATVSACALQLAYNFGAREILLCGVDMSGDAYFDGTSNPSPNHGDTWPATTRLNRLVGWLRSHKGLRIHSVSPTRIDVPDYAA